MRIKKLFLFFIVLLWGFFAPSIRAECSGSGVDSGIVYGCTYNDVQRYYYCSVTSAFSESWTCEPFTPYGEPTVCERAAYPGMSCVALGDGCSITGYDFYSTSAGCSTGGGCSPSCACADTICPGDTCDNGCSGGCEGRKAAVNGGWSAWSAWSACSGCSQSRGRTCTNPSPACWGRGCDGSPTETQACGSISGGWGGWSSDCSPKCGETATRSCTNPSPACSGATCVGGSSMLCSNDDNGAPGTPTINSPNGTSGSPTPISGIAPQAVTLSWNVTVKAEKYLVVLYNSAGLIWSPPATTAISATTNPLVAGIYHWRVSAVNATCPPDQTGSASAWGYFRVNSPPTIVRVMVANYDVAAVTNDNTTDNHICKNEFTGTTKPREVVFGIFVNDPDGVGDSGPPPVLHWNGQDYPTSWTGISGGNNAAQARVDYTSYVGTAPQSLHEVTATYSDRWGSAATNIIPPLPANQLKWKVWNCQVLVLGTLYDDSSQSTICSGNWLNLSKLSGDAGFNALKFTNTASPYPSVVMSPNAPADYSSASGSGLIWGKDYISVFNNGLYSGNTLGNLLVSGIKTKIIELGTGTYNCPFGQAFNIGNLVSPYSTNPSAQIDFSFIQDQKAWYQVEGAGVKSAGPLSYGVPVTADPDVNRFLTLGDPINDNGLVSGTSFLNTNGNNNNNEFGFPNNWWITENTNDLDIYNYNYFYNNFFVKAGIGSTGTDWASKPLNGIYLVKNDLNIDSDFVLDDPLNTKTMMVVVNGNINIASEVKRLDGIYIANKAISIGGTDSNQLVVNGMLYARGSVELYRGFTNKIKNNTIPAVKVNYSPGLIFKLDPKILRVLSGWREE